MEPASYIFGENDRDEIPDKIDIAYEVVQPEEECQCILSPLKPWFFDPHTPSDGHLEDCPLYIPTK